MRLAIVHSHLRKGGVTKVIATALQALGTEALDVVVISSTQPEEPMPCRCVVVPELAYDDTFSQDKVNRLHEALVEAVRPVFGALPDLWHVHNHCLGKNVNFPAAFKRILDAGAVALLQVHDFSEDGRPGNYAAQRQAFSEDAAYNAALYPMASQIGYAVLNGRDKHALIKAGIPEERVFWLPNAVTVPSLQNTSSLSADSGKPLILYPTRGIRRKNLGELLLMAMVYPEYRYGTTLFPKNPEWIEIHDTWVRLGEELNLPVTFGMGEQPGNTFEGLLHEASAMVTTSVGEGFGLAFLEPWLFGKPLCGRDLPDITSDFKDNGITLPDLYPEWKIPCDLFDSVGLRTRFDKSVRSVFSAYDRTITKNEITHAWEGKTRGDQVDFGFLDEEAQSQALMALSSQPERIHALRTLSMPIPDPDLLSANALKIQSAYGVESYGKKLRDIYARLLEPTPVPPVGLDAGKILDEFLDLDRFTFLRT